MRQLSPGNTATINHEAAGIAACSRHFVGEPRVAELLRDPIARALMAADKTDHRAVVALLESVNGRRAA